MMSEENLVGYFEQRLELATRITRKLVKERLKRLGWKNTTLLEEKLLVVIFDKITAPTYYRRARDLPKKESRHHETMVFKFSRSLRSNDSLIVWLRRKILEPHRRKYNITYEFIASGDETFDTSGIKLSIPPGTDPRHLREIRRCLLWLGKKADIEVKEVQEQ